MKKIVFILLLTGLSITSVSGQTWTNPLALNGEWDGSAAWGDRGMYGIGDPYILKYRGIYYLYCSTRDNNVGVKCWSTKDFITWSSAITCTSDPISRSAYAPEVVYWNGKFYMYTSPAGNGHYVLESDSPLGPFTRVTENIGKGIDGSIFIEDNGNWYFYHTGNNRIAGCRMTTPTTPGTAFDTGITMNNAWTEGPTVIKREGVYYLIYTGNHVISKGYRIDYAQSTSGPFSFSPQSGQNPILISAEGSHVGLGHGSAFIGPDLDTYYYTYHNLVSGRGPQRQLNFDRIAWNGSKLLLLGPTTWAQQAFRQPEMADFFDRDEPGDNWSMPNGGNWSITDRDRLIQSEAANTDFHKAIYNQPTATDYIAEFTVKKESNASNQARWGAVFGYTNEENYGIAVLNSNSNQLEINFRQNNQWETPAYYALPDNYNLSAWHTIRIEKSGTNYTFFIDGMQKAKITHSLGSGKIGYASSLCQAGFGYIAFSNKAGGSGIFDIYKPVPGIIAAVHYNSGGEGIAYHDLTPGNAGEGYIRNDSVDIAPCSEGGFAINSESGEWYKYNVNVKATGLYHLGLRYSTTENTQIRIKHENTELTDWIPLPLTGANNWRTLTVKDLQLPAGYQTLTIETAGGNCRLYELHFEPADSAITILSDAFNTAFSPEWNYADGTWTVSSGEAVINGFGKRTMGNTGWTDYTVQVNITCVNGINAGLIFRATHPALGEAGNSAQAGTDFLQGYFVGLTSNSVVLGKHNYNWTQLAAKTGESYLLNNKYTLKVEVKGHNIKAYVNGVLKIDYSDSTPFICGKVGLRVCNSHVRFDNFSVATMGNTPPVAIDEPPHDASQRIYPIPTDGTLTLEFETPGKRMLTVSDKAGKILLRRPVDDSATSLDFRHYPADVYLLTIDDGKQKRTTRIIKN
ncbi:MAG: family 43 glycosylhydrolase [Dysgonamonadaceae bacterium]|jgi:beta-xylosidase|nr:family 43 glycosylhydrolase [Dysgonamonadaceae bacterium]